MPRRRGHRAGLTAGLAAGLALLALAACSTAGAGGATSGSRAPVRLIQVVAAENFWGSIAAQLGGSHVARHQRSSQPAATRTTTSRRPPTAGRSPAQTSLSSTASATTPGPEARCGQPVAGRTVLDVGDLVGVQDGDNPHRWYNPPTCAGSSAGSAADYQPARPGRRGVLPRRSRQRSRRPGSRRTTGAIARSSAVRRHAGRRLGEHLRDARAGARPGPVTPPLPARPSARAPTHRGRQGDDRPPDQTDADQGLRLQLQNATPDVQAQVDEAAGGDPGRHDHRDADARRRRPSRTGRPPAEALQAALAGATGMRPRTDDRRPGGRGRRRGRDAAAAARVVARRQPRGRGGRVRRRARPQRRRQVHADQGRARPDPAGRAARSRCSGEPAGAGQRPHRLPAAAAQLRRVSCGSAASTSSGSASTATGGACRCRGRPLQPAGAAAARGSTRSIELVGATAYAHRPIGAALRRRAAAAADRAGARARPRLLLLDEPLDSLDLPNQARDRRADRADLPRARASPC